MTDFKVFVFAVIIIGWSHLHTGGLTGHEKLILN